MYVETKQSITNSSNEDDLLQLAMGTSLITKLKSMNQFR